ncbi:MAG TPA: M13 family metallopeptidase N-terminal domain-containing protein, partial [Flavisolibacter sp.]|nr:M13 family metallopeptidase N-terminal domain-containing protein [Flavisolibacter sp.]
MRIFLISAALATLAASCNNIVKSSSEQKKDILISDMDSTVNPSQDFFMYANGGWIKRNPIPSDQGSWGIAQLVIEENLKRLRTISEKAAASNAAEGTTELKIGDFWATAMDSAKIEQLGLKPLQAYLDKINAISDVPSLVTTVSELKNIGSYSLFNDYVTQDDKNSDLMTYRLNQGGLGLPEREYYFKTDSATVNIRTQYVNYITKVLTMSGEDSTSAYTAAKNILALETKLAQSSRKIEDLRDPYKNYNKMAINELGKLSSNINWSNYLKTMGVHSIDSVIVGQPEFFKTLNQVLTSTPINDWKAYLRFSLISDFSGGLPDQYGIAAF